MIGSIWFKSFIKEVERWIVEGFCVSASWSDVNLLPSSWMLAAAAESFMLGEEVQKICTWSHILSLLLPPLTFHCSQWIFTCGLHWMLCKTKIKLDFGGKALCSITHRKETHFQRPEYCPATDASSHTLLPVNHLKPTKKTPFFSWHSFRKRRQAEDKRSRRFKIFRGFKLAHTSDSGYNAPLQFPNVVSMIWFGSCEWICWICYANFQKHVC